MKRFDDSTKKLIKNVAALITSALVLIAATVAWFQSGSKADVNRVGAAMSNENYEVTNFKMKDSVARGILESATVGGSNPGFIFDYGESQAPTLAGKMDPANWEETEDFNIASLQPGEYRSFMLCVTTAGSMWPTLTVDSITAAAGLTAADRETVLKNVYIHAVVVRTTTSTQMIGGEEQSVTTYAAVGSICSSLYDLINASGKISQRLTGDVQITGSYDVLLDIGIPGDHVTTVTVDANQNESSSTDNLRNAHDALRQIGTSITLNPVSVGR